MNMARVEIGDLKPGDVVHAPNDVALRVRAVQRIGHLCIVDWSDGFSSAPAPATMLLDDPFYVERK